MVAKGVQELTVYKTAFKAAMDVFNMTIAFPAHEKYSLTDQIRRSSRSVCSNLAESWRKRQYPLVFRNKLTDAAQEAGETRTWLEFCLACNYIKPDQFSVLDNQYEQICKMLSSMERMHQDFCR